MEKPRMSPEQAGKNRGRGLRDHVKPDKFDIFS